MASILKEANAPRKRKRGFPTRDDKMSCVKRMENGESTSRLAKEMGVPPSTLREWRRDLSPASKSPSPSRPKKSKLPQSSPKISQKSPKVRSTPSPPPTLHNTLNSLKKLELMLQIGLNPSTPLISEDPNFLISMKSECEASEIPSAKSAKRSQPIAQKSDLKNSEKPVQNLRRSRRSQEAQKVEAKRAGAEKSAQPISQTEKSAQPIFHPDKSVGPEKPKAQPRTSEGSEHEPISDPHPLLSNLVLRWFEKNRLQGLSIPPALVKAQATSLNRRLQPSSTFQGTDSWLSLWQAENDISYLPETQLRVSALTMRDEQFSQEVERVLGNESLHKCQVFNCCEVTWAWKDLPPPWNTGTNSQNEDVVTVMAFSNADESLKVPLVILRRPGHVQVLENHSNLPLYSVERDEPWMFSSILSNWFKRDFVPAVTKFLTNQRLPIQAVLLVDPSRFLPIHLFYEEICVEFLPNSLTCLLLPFYQKLEAVKLHCRRSLILSLGIHCDRGREVGRHLKESITIINLLNWIHLAWEGKQGSTEKGVLKALRGIDGFRTISEEQFETWLTRGPETEQVLEGETIEIVQMPDLSAFGEFEGSDGTGTISPEDAVRCLDSVIEFFAHWKNLTETEMTALKAARERANSMGSSV